MWDSGAKLKGPLKRTVVFGNLGPEIVRLIHRIDAADKEIGMCTLGL